MSVLLHLDTENKKVKENRSNDDSGRDQEEFWENFENGLVIEEEWCENFRMSRATFYKLCDQLQLCLQKRRTIMREPLAIDTRVAITLYCLADEGRYQKLANSFGIGKSLVSVVLKEVMGIISAKLRSKDTWFPCINEETEQAVNNFCKYHRFPQCLGAVDCTYIKMKQP